MVAWGWKKMYCIMKCNISPHFCLLTFYAFFFGQGLGLFCLMKFYSMSGFGMGPGLGKGGMEWWWDFASEIATIFRLCDFCPTFPSLYSPVSVIFTNTFWDRNTSPSPPLFIISLKYLIAPYRPEQVGRNG